MKRLFSTFIMLLGIFMVASAQSSNHQYITVVAEPDHADWTYHVGEKVHITAYAIKENALMRNTEIAYSYGPDKLDAIASGTVKTGRDGMAHFTVPGAKEPGFTSVRVKVTHEGRTYSSMTNVAADPLMIQPTTTMPTDFGQYWSESMAKASAIPMMPSLRHSAE